MNKLRVGLLLLTISAPFLGFSQGVLVGQDSSNNVITTAVPFLTITPDARAAGMGDTGAATSADANSTYWNVGKMAFIDKGYGVTASYTPWLAKIINDMYIFNLAGFYKISKEQTVSASMKYFDLGEIVFNTGPDPSQIIGRFNPREFAFDVGYSRKLTEEFSIGGAVRYIHSNLTGALSTGSTDARPGNSVAVDLGVYYTKPMVAKNSELSFGAAITNLGAKISYSDANQKSFIPTNLRFGSAYKTYFNPLHSLSFALDFNKLLVPSPGHQDKSLLSGVFGSFTDADGGAKEEFREFTVSGGAEYWYNEVFAGRVGYFLEAKDKGNRKYMTFGIGARHKKF
ncbi:MAG TPA: type IX secretion system outer membrane channel protein PorV, partial [Cyclobacteriaceae bacterium]